VASPEEPNGTELQLALNNTQRPKRISRRCFNRASRRRCSSRGSKGDYERIKARGAEFTMPPKDVTGSTITMLNDTCGNLIQLTQLAGY